MTSVVRGNPEILRKDEWKGISNIEAEPNGSAKDAEDAWSSGYRMGNSMFSKLVKKQLQYAGDEDQVKLEPKMVSKRQKVSLTHFPEEISRMKNGRSFISQMNIREANNDINRRGLPFRQLHKARYTKRRDVPYRNYGYSPVDSTGMLKKRRKWLFAPRRLAFPDGIRNGVLDDVEGDGAVVEQFEPCCRTGQTQCTAPQTYMVEVEPTEDGDEGGTPFVAQPQLPLCNKYYYVFEKKPFKVKFLNFVSSPNKDCISPFMKSSFNMNPALKLSMPAFQCKPPECREVLFCKYFQCTSLGFFPDSRNCRKYFFCDLNSNGFVLYHMLCPRGRIFDPRIRECRLKEMMDKREVQRCWMETAKFKRDGKARIKKNEFGSLALIKYKERAQDEKDRNPSNVGVKNKVYELEQINSRHNPKHTGIKKTNQPNDKITTIPVANCPTLNFSTEIIPIPVLPTLPKCCETTPGMVSKTPVSQTAHTIPAQSQTQPKPIPPPPTTPPVTVMTSMLTTHAPLTTQAVTISVSIQKPTVPICPPPPKRKKIACPTSKSLEEYYIGDLDSDAYQDDMQEDEYSDDYYDVPDTEDEQEADYEWLKKNLDEYIDLLKQKNEEKTETDTVNPEFTSEQSTPSLSNVSDYTNNKKEKNQEKDKLLGLDADRGKRSQEKAENVTLIDGRKNSNDLPDFEQCYNDKKAINLDGYPCKQYGRYPDKYDSACYYECGAQPDGNMKVEHKRCPKGEQFSPKYLECIATEYLKVTHRKRRVPDAKKANKQRPTPEPEYNYEDDKEMPNEWLDASHGNKVPNEFKSKTKHTLRIFHLHCKRNSSEPLNGLKGSRQDQGHKHQHHNTRSFIIRPNKKEEQIDDDEDEDYEDDEEDYYDIAEDGKTERSTHSIIDSSSTTAASNKVLLDADIHVDRQFENALKNILGKTNDLETNKDSIMITLSGDKGAERSKRNFIKEMFSKKSKNVGEDPEKEGVVSMLTLINGLPSEYERDTLLQKLERRKMMNAHLYRNRQRTFKRKEHHEWD